MPFRAPPLVAEAPAYCRPQGPVPPSEGGVPTSGPESQGDDSLLLVDVEPATRKEV